MAQACSVRIRPLNGAFALAVDPNAPVISALTDSIAYGTINLVKNFTITDAQSTMACNSTYLTVTSSDAAVIPAANVVWSGTAPNCIATITGVSNTGSGSTTLTVTVTDETALTDTDSFVVTVVPLTLPIAIAAHSSTIADFDGDGFGDIAVIASAGGGNGRYRCYPDHARAAYAAL
jgi:hypothetical protein